MKKILDYKHAYVGSTSSVGGRCRVRLFIDDKQSKVVGICSHLPENKYNMSCSKKLSTIIGDVEKAHLAEHDYANVVWVEHKPANVEPNMGQHSFGMVDQHEVWGDEWVEVNEDQLLKRTGLTLKLIA